METTHVLYLATPPRPSFYMDATPEEYAVIEQHFAFLDGLRQQGKLVLAGPALDGAFGVAILKITDLDEARTIVATDPAVVTGLFTPSLHPLSLGPVTP
ncbi:hypothetical protein VE25_15580 [Devosia geojensis]|uniref:YCII-related domain-containing protein n=1 Tax=Devosia geojensis TaxID=443610 RepID=A0A0F5FQP6_9HYPH|nr:YciI family protein [Devosia geojensis]KKB10905.1 hypothetical protein VE25_15580 [Devosia geojensis]